MSNVTMVLQNHKKIDDSCYKIVCKATDNLGYADAQANVYRMFNNKFKLIPNSIKNNGSNVYSMLIKANLKSISMDCLGEKSNKYKISAGVYTDSEDNSIWEVQSVDGQKRLVMKTPEDLEACFKYGGKIEASALKTTLEVFSGDFVTFYNKNSGIVEAGFALVSEDGDVEVFTEDENLVGIEDPDQIINGIDLTECDLNPVEAAFTKGDGKKVLDYMKKIYKSKDMIDSLKDIMDYKFDRYKKFETKASINDENFEEIKADIQNYIINQAVEDLKQDLTAPEGIVPEPTEESSTELDFASEEEKKDFLKESEAQDIVTEPQVKEDFFEDVTFTEKDPAIEEVSAEEQFTDDELSELLEEHGDEVVTESDLDEGDFEELKDITIDEGDLVDKLESMLKPEDDKKVQAAPATPAVEIRDMHTAIHNLILFKNKNDAVECFKELKAIKAQPDVEDYDVLVEHALRKAFDMIEVDWRTIREDKNYLIVNPKNDIPDVY